MTKKLRVRKRQILSSDGERRGNTRNPEAHNPILGQLIPGSYPYSIYRFNLYSDTSRNWELSEIKTIFPQRKRPWDQRNWREKDFIGPGLLGGATYLQISLITELLRNEDLVFIVMQLETQMPEDWEGFRRGSLPWQVGLEVHLSYSSSTLSWTYPIRRKMAPDVREDSECAFSFKYCMAPVFSSSSLSMGPKALCGKSVCQKFPYPLSFTQLNRQGWLLI